MVPLPVQLSRSFLNPMTLQILSGRSPQTEMKNSVLASTDGANSYIWLRSWDEKRVGDWLRSINCAQYEHVFKGKSPVATILQSC